MSRNLSPTSLNPIIETVSDPIAAVGIAVRYSQRHAWGYEGDLTLCKEAHGRIRPHRQDHHGSWTIVAWFTTDSFGLPQIRVRHAPFTVDHAFAVDIFLQTEMHQQDINDSPAEKKYCWEGRV